MNEFVPDDEDESEVEEDEIDTTKVDVDPDLFGEFPDTRIDEITVEGNAVATAEQIYEWNREVALIQLTGACPHCDGPLNKHESRNTDDEKIVEWNCEDCHKGWMQAASEL